MKKFLLGAVALTMLVSACKKDDDNNGTPANTFTVNGTSYTTSTVQASGSLITAAGTNGSNAGGIIFSFPGSAAPAAGTYKVVADATNANEVDFVASSSVGGTGTAYASTGAGTVNATVTVNNGKISISMPDAPAKTANGTSTVNVKANISQP